MKTLLVPVAALLAVATAAVAQPSSEDGSNGNQTGAAKTNDKGERLICRTVHDADVGSLVQGRTRRCLTVEQWRAIRR